MWVRLLHRICVFNLSAASKQFVTYGFNQYPSTMSSHQFQRWYHVTSRHCVRNHLFNKILTTGPISVAEFMRIALTNPTSGYYVHKEALGPSGDFVTSPELSQIFGELIGVWILNEWMALNKPSYFQVVELGPGKGTLCVDILRTFKQLKNVLKDCNFSFHLVEISPVLSKIQFKNICSPSEISSLTENLPNECYLSGKTDQGVSVHWHTTVCNVDKSKCTFYIAHEFFDALPIHKFAKTKDGWKEVYVDINRDSESQSLQFVLLPIPTPACKMLVKTNETRNQIEVSPETGSICQKIAKNISEYSGAALFADYGHFGHKEDTLRAFKQHSLVDVLSDVGDCDITADVDFKYISDCVREYNINTSGPLMQRNFLQNMGVDTRLQMLLRSTTDKNLCRQLIGSYNIMMNPKEMGERFKFFAMTSKLRRSDGQFSAVTGFA